MGDSNYCEDCEIVDCGETKANVECALWRDVLLCAVSSFGVRRSSYITSYESSKIISTCSGPTRYLAGKIAVTTMAALAAAALVHASTPRLSLSYHDG